MLGRAAEAVKRAHARAAWRQAGKPGCAGSKDPIAYRDRAICTTIRAYFAHKWRRYDA